MADDPCNLRAAQNLSHAVGHVESHVAALLLEPREELASRLAPLENAKLSAALAYTMHSLFFILLRTKGVDCQQHEVKTELQRVSSCFRKIKDAEAAVDSPAAAQPTTRVDKAASRRVVEHALAGAASSAPPASPDADRSPPRLVAGKRRQPASLSPDSAASAPKMAKARPGRPPRARAPRLPPSSPKAKKRKRT